MDGEEVEVGGVRRVRVFFLLVAETPGVQCTL